MISFLEKVYETLKLKKLGETIVLTLVLDTESFECLAQMQ
jgi:hypothetical protein